MTQSDKFYLPLIFDSKGLPPKFGFILSEFEQINQLLISLKSSKTIDFQMIFLGVEVN